MYRRFCENIFPTNIGPIDHKQVHRFFKDTATEMREPMGKKGFFPKRIMIRPYVDPVKNQFVLDVK